MLFLTLPLLFFFYKISSFDTLSRRLFGTLFWANFIFVAYLVLPTLDGKLLAKSLLIAIPLTLIALYGIIKLLDLGIKFCDYIIKKTS